MYFTKSMSFSNVVVENPGYVRVLFTDVTEREEG